MLIRHYIKTIVMKFISFCFKAFIPYVDRFIKNLFKIEDRIKNKVDIKKR